MYQILHKEDIIPFQRKLTIKQNTYTCSKLMKTQANNKCLKSTNLINSKVKIFKNKAIILL